MSVLAVYVCGLVLAAALLFAVWVVQLFTRNAGLVDVIWSAAVGLLGVFYAVVGDAPVATRILLALMAGVWGLRLAAYLGQRMRGRPEDSRYAAARASWGRRADLYMLGFFLFQALVAWILSLPFLVVAYMPTNPPLALATLGVLVWVISVGGEAVADWQLNRFKRDPDNAGVVYNGGLWRYSRHPNYFFESLHWVSYVIIAIGAPFWWATLFSPVIMAVLLLKVSGIPMIENRDAATRRTGHDAYVRTTNAFIPWPPKRDANGNSNERV